MINPKLRASSHMVVGSMCAGAGVTDLFMGHINGLTTINLVLAALNFWLGNQRLEGK